MNHRSWRYLTVCTILFSLLSWQVQAESVSFNLKNADIRSVVDMVSGITGKNFIIDPRVKGKVTLVSSTPVAPEDVYDIFLSIIKVHGYVALEEGGVVNILPANEGVRGAPISKRTPGDDGQMQVRIVSVNNVKATQLVPTLKPLISKNGHLAAHNSSNSLVISDTGRRVKRLVEVVQRLDQKTDSSLEAVKLQHAAASQVIKTLQPLLSGSGSKNTMGGLKGGGIKLAADDRSNTVLMMGNQSLRARLRGLIEQMDVPIEHRGETRVIHLKFAKAVDLAEVLRKTLSEKYKEEKSSKRNAAPTRQVNIQADEDMNALLVTAGPDQHAEVRAVIRDLDVRRAQVLVESLIVEMSDDRARNLGIQWMAGQRKLMEMSDMSSLAANAMQQGNLVGLLKGSRGLNIGMLARALANDADANIISTPSLITLDNAEAEINVGREVPFVTGSYTGSGNSSSPNNPFTTIQRNDVGLKLKITPQINQGSAVRLDIDQEISNLLPGAAAQFGATDVVTSKRSIKTSVVVEDGSILVLGGLVDDTLRESQVKIPMLGDLPVLGGLFSYREATKEKRNLMIFIRTKVLRDAESSREVSEQKYAKVRGYQLEKYQTGAKLVPNKDIPLLELAPGIATQPPKTGEIIVSAKPLPFRPAVARSMAPARLEQHHSVQTAPVKQRLPVSPTVQQQDPPRVDSGSEQPRSFPAPVKQHREPVTAERKSDPPARLEQRHSFPAPTKQPATAERKNNPSAEEGEQYYRDRRISVPDAPKPGFFDLFD